MSTNSIVFPANSEVTNFLVDPWIQKSSYSGFHEKARGGLSWRSGISRPVARSFQAWKSSKEFPSPSQIEMLGLSCGFTYTWHMTARGPHPVV